MKGEHDCSRTDPCGKYIIVMMDKRIPGMQTE